jgi:asparagine synthase (glutamine-hydrolysing)
MCGIAGVFGRSDDKLVGRMLDALRHRGPDDGHIVSGPNFTMGTRRLSIIDVGGGRQPLTNEDGSVFAAQNGEIYNFPTLRPSLLEAGHQLRTHTDTEVLPHLWEDFGEALPEHIQGMFAVAVWDDRRQTGLLARDRMGKKPLYYWQSGAALYFASELKALLTIPGFSRRLNREALHHYLGYKHVPHPLTIFEGVSVLPPAHRVLFRPGSEPAISRYWTLSFCRSTPVPDEREAVDELLARLTTAVQRRLMSDVPIGFFLSGGIDSSLTVALAAELAPRIKTFTLTYSDQATTLGTEHHEETISFAHYPETLPQILRAFDEPFAGVTSTYFLSQRIAQYVKVAVAGDGADELFGSYLSHRLAAGMESSPIVASQPDWMWRSSLLVLSDEEKAALYSPEARAQAPFSTAEHVRGAFDNLTASDPLNRMLEAEWHGIFPDQVLTFVDRLSMAHSLEVRSAFLDTDVVEFVASLPGSMKIGGGLTKRLLKLTALRRFPEEMVHRPKEGFLMPITEWMRGDLRPWARETLSPSRLAQHGIFSPPAVQGLLDRLDDPGCDYRTVNKVLGLVIFQHWYEMYLA